MSANSERNEATNPSRLGNLLTGLELFRTYRSEWFASDLVAGLSVAAVALPIGIAYAQLAGFPPVVGIYSCILPLVGYFLVGSSRQLVVNPDAAACSIVAATVAPLAVGDASRYLELSIALTILTGILLIAGGLVGLGVIANFLSRPILTGYLNGIALSIIVGQFGKLLGFSVPSGGFFLTLWQVIKRIKETNVTTFVLGLTLLVLLLSFKYFLKRLPGPLIVAALAAAAVYVLKLGPSGITVVGSVPAGFPAPLIPTIHRSEIWPLIGGASGIALVSFCSMMTTARGFAAKNGYRIDVNQEMFALGVSDLASAFNRGFVVSGADSRTAVADSSGGKTQVASLVAAAAMAIVLLFLTQPLSYVPTCALAAILISSALGLFDFYSLRHYYNLSQAEFRQAIVAMLGVMTIGVLPGVLIAVGLALLKLLRQASRPNDAVLGLISRNGDDYCAPEVEGAQTIPGVIVYRFDAALVFFNADYFSERVRLLISKSVSPPTHFILVAEAVMFLDVSGAFAIANLQSELSEQGITFGLARARGNFLRMLELSGTMEKIGEDNVFHTAHHALLHFKGTSL